MTWKSGPSLLGKPRGTVQCAPSCRGAMATLSASEGPSPAQACALILFFTVLIQSLCVSITYVYFSGELKQMREMYSNSHVACLLKEDGLWDPNDGESMSNPCWPVKWQFYQFTKKMLLQTYEKTFTTDQGNQQNISRLVRRTGRSQGIAAHVTMRRSTSRVTIPSSKDENVSGNKIYNWEPARIGQSFLKNFHVQNGELIVHETGLYYVYAQIYFRIQEFGSKNTSSSKQLVQYIYKYTNYPDPILLTKSARTSCWSKDLKYGLYSIYQGGLFELQENDRIFVSVTNEHLIEKNQEASYFGAFLID